MNCKTPYCCGTCQGSEKVSEANGISRDGLAFQLKLHKNSLYGEEVGIKRKSGHFSHTQLTKVNFVRIAAFFSKQPGEMLQEVLDETKSITKKH